MDGAKEDLVDMFIVHTTEEIQVRGAWWRGTLDTLPWHHGHYINMQCCWCRICPVTRQCNVGREHCDIGIGKYPFFMCTNLTWIVSIVMGKLQN